MARPIVVEVIARTEGFTKGVGKAESGLAKLGKAAAIGGAALGVGLAVGLEKSVKAAMEAQVSTARLNAAFKASGLSAKLYSKQIATAESASRKLGFTDEEAKTALGSLIVATHSMTKASKDLSIAQDIARFKHTDLTAATKMLTMAMAGSQRATKQLGIDVPKVTTAQDALKASGEKLTTTVGKLDLANAKAMDRQVTIAKVIDTVKEKLHGQAAAYASTASGAMEVFRAQLTHIEVEIGQKLLPVMTRAIQWVTTHWPEITAAIQNGWAQIKPTLMALESLIVSVVTVIRTHWSTIGPIVQQVVNVIKAQLAIVSGVIRFFAAVLRGDWSGAWNALKGIVLGVFNELRAILTIQKDVLVAAMKGIGTAMVAGLEAGVKAAWNGLLAGFHDLINLIPKFVRKLLGISSPSTVFETIGVQIVQGMVRGLEKAGPALLKKATSLVGGLTGSLGGSAPSTTSKNNNVELGRKMAAAYGWGGGQEFAALFELWQRESGWSNTAKNPSSGAYGIPQALPPTKMPRAAQEAGGSSAAAQIGWGLPYIKARYGDPIRAWAHEQAAGWYAKGGIFNRPTIIGVGEKGPEAVIPLNKARGSGGTTVINFSFPNLVGSEREMEQMVHGALDTYSNRNGGLALGGGF